MKRYALILFVFVVSGIKFSFAQKLAFSYDASGNQIERRWICINCLSANQMAADKNNLIAEEFKNGLVTKRGIKAYPNPLKETLNISWGVPDKIYLKYIQVYSMGGNSVFKRNYNADERQTTITFQQLPPGTYLLVGQYSDDKIETIKLIKN